MVRVLDRIQNAQKQFSKEFRTSDGIEVREHEARRRGHDAEEKRGENNRDRDR